MSLSPPGRRRRNAAPLRGDSRLGVRSVGRARTAHVFGNKIKLKYLYADNDGVAKAREAARPRAQRDLLRKVTCLAALEVA